MRIERLDLAEVARLGGPQGAAAHVRALVPDGASVEQAVKEIVGRVRAEGDTAVIELTRRFDTGGNEPKSLVAESGELDAAIKELPLELVHPFAHHRELESIRVMLGLKPPCSDAELDP